MTHHHDLLGLSLARTQPSRSRRRIDTPTLLAGTLSILLPWLVVVGMVVLVTWLFIRGGGL